MSKPQSESKIYLKNLPLWALSSKEQCKLSEISKSDSSKIEKSISSYDSGIEFSNMLQSLKNNKNIKSPRSVKNLNKSKIPQFIAEENKEIIENSEQLISNKEEIIENSEQLISNSDDESFLFDDIKLSPSLMIINSDESVTSKRFHSPLQFTPNPRRKKMIKKHKI